MATSDTIAEKAANDVSSEQPVSDQKTSSDTSTSESVVTDQCGSAGTENEEAKSDAESKENVTEPKEDPKKDENQKQSTEPSPIEKKDMEASSEEKLEQKIKESDPCSAIIKTTEENSNDQNVEQSLPSVDNTEIDNKQEVSSSNSQDVTSSSTQEVTSLDTQEVTSLDTPEVTSPILHEAKTPQVTTPSEQEVLSNKETPCEILPQKEPADEKPDVTSVNEATEKTALQQKDESNATEGETTDKINGGPKDADIQEKESESETICTDDKNKQEKDTEEETTNDKTSAVLTEQQTEQSLPTNQTVNEGKSTCETQASKESDIAQDGGKVQKQSRGQRSSASRMTDSKDQGQIIPDIQEEPLALVTKPRTNDQTKPSLPDEQPTSTEKPAVVLDETSDRQVVEKSTGEAEPNVSDTSGLDESNSTDCSNLSTPDRNSRGSGLYRSYKCKGCKYNTPIKTNLRRHASINIEYKPFLCNLCGHKFTDKSTLNFHNKKRHSGFENYEFSPEKEKDNALDKYLEMCIRLEGKVKSEGGVLRNPSKYKDCNLVTFDMFKHFKSTNPKTSTGKKDMDHSGDGEGELNSSESGLEKKIHAEKKSKIMKTKEHVYVTYPDEPTVQSTGDVTEISPVVGPRRRGPGRKKKIELGSYPVVSTAENASQITGNVNVSPQMISQRNQTPLIAVPHAEAVMSAQAATQAGRINLIQTFGGIAIPVPMQMPLPIPIQVPAQIPTQIPAQMAVQPQTVVRPQVASQASQTKLPDTTRQPTENEDKKKKGRTKTIREILNLDNGVRRQKLSHGQMVEAKASTAGSLRYSLGYKAGRGRGRKRGSSRRFEIETDQSSTDNSVPESEVSGSDGDPTWRDPTEKRRGRGIGRGHGIGPLKRKYMRMKLTGSSQEHFVMKSKRGSGVSVNIQNKEKLVETKRKKTDSDLKEEVNAGAEISLSSEKKRVGRKRKIDCVTDPATRGLEKQRKMASETGILTEETINNSLLALKRRQDSITATGTRVKRKYVKRTKSLTMPPKRNRSRTESNNASSLLSTSSTSSTMEEQRDLNETGISVPASPEKRKRGRPALSKKPNIDLEKRHMVRGPYKKKLKLALQVSESEQKTVIHSGCDKCPSEEGSVDVKRKRMSTSPGRANCHCATSEGDGENPRTSVKKPTLLKSTRMTNYVKKYSQKYSKLAKAKSQAKVMVKAKDPQKIKCPLCDYQSKSINGVRLHAFWVHKMCKYTCTECTYFTLNRYEGLAHYKEEHPGKTVSLVRSFCLLKDLEVDTTPGLQGKVMTLSIDGQTSPSKQQTPSKIDVYEYNLSSESSPSKSTGAPDITNTEDRARVLKGRCPKCPFESTVRGVGQHLMLAHDTMNWVCKECKYKSHSKSLTIQHIRRNHKDKQPIVYRKAILVKPDPELNLEISSPKGSSTPKSSKGSIEPDSTVSDLSPTMPKLKKFPKTWKMKLNSMKDRENLKQLIAKRKGKTGKVKTSEIVPAEKSSTSYTLHPRKMEALEVGFSCVYCFYAAPLRHQLHLHCYDKHTNHPACLMEFTKDTTVMDFLGDKSLMKLTDKGKPLKSELGNGKKEMFSDKERVQRIIKWNNDPASEDKEDVSLRGEETKKGDNCLDTKNQHEELPIKDKSLKESGVAKDVNIGVLSVQPHKVTLSHFSTQSDNEEDRVTKTVCPADKPVASSKLRICKPFSNPLTPLVASLGASQVKLHDTFQSSLDDLDTILSNFGVRTLNMDMLTRKQFTDYIHRFGNSLQQM
ncbi:uncharacterized protein LOC110457723 isoform X2 [Mizuhopecten yessoensis]|uniref:uncharacterized protein LOC110457723 isoform X2 n=1 Tax=Mizuhopecten yessoensis TaxID=6573 RepID=UPI000B45F57F|nr:uncharacterized protein LOC110457723 isoform X2 [Mizuhopecten yessoensis]